MSRNAVARLGGAPAWMGGSSESTYMLFTAARLLADGFDVFRLNFRDHGDTHHLNAGLFLFSGLDEIVCAVGDIARRFPSLPLFAGGYSLGGNFALSFSSYSLTGGRLSQLGVPVSILAAADDPVVPVTEFRQLGLPVHSYVEISTWGGQRVHS